MRTVNTALLEVMFRLMIDMRIVQHCLRWYAPDVETGAPEATTLLYTCSLISCRFIVIDVLEEEMIRTVPSIRAEQP